MASTSVCIHPVAHMIKGHLDSFLICRYETFTAFYIKIAELMTAHSALFKQGVDSSL